MLERHRQQRRRDALARRKQQVQLAGLGLVGHLLRQGDQLIRRIPHRRHYDDEAVPCPHSLDDALRDVLDALSIAYRRPAVLLDDKPVPAHFASTTSAPVDVGRVIIVRPGVSRARAASNIASAIPSSFVVASAQIVDPPPER